MHEARTQRRLAAILAADIVGYSRLVRADEEGTIARVRAFRRELVNPKVAKHAGRVVKLMGDGILIEFPSAVDAVRCAVEIQQAMALRNADVSEVDGIALRVGINLGDVVVEGDDIQGDGVNVAARLQGIAPAGGICLSDAVYEQVRDRTGFTFNDRGAQELKNINRAVRVWEWLPGTAESSTLTSSGVGGYCSALTRPEKPSIAVLPFQNMSGDPEQEYFADGICEDIITSLSRISWFFVTARNSTFTYKGQAVDVKQVGRELGVRYVLEGSVRRAGHRLRVTAQLIDATSGSHIWAERYDRELTDIFEVQDEITRSVVASTQTQIHLAEGLLSKPLDRPSLPVWILVNRAIRLIYELTPDALAECIRLGEEAVALDPGSSRAHFVLAEGLFQFVWMGYAKDPSRMLGRCRKAIADAIRIDRESEYVHWLAGLIRLLEGDHDRALAYMQRALQINPNCSLAHGSLGTVLNFSGAPERAVEANEIAIRSDPRDPSIFFRYSGLAMSHFLLGDLEKAIEWGRRSVHLKPSWCQANIILVAALVEAERLQEAEAALADYLASCDGASLAQVQALPFRNPEHRARIVEALRAANCPENPNPILPTASESTGSASSSGG